MTTATLTLPHPRMHERAFVLRPLLDLAPTARIPGRGLARHDWPGVRGQRIARN
jgi:2-amino-4-hydroxy-6-hydroxymethyldihydropteridine diphosphokinase